MRPESSLECQSRRTGAPDPGPSLLFLRPGTPAPQALVGGKAAGLAVLIGLGLPVPRAFVVTAAAFHRFREHNGISGEGPEAAHAIGRGTWPAGLKDEIVNGVAALGAERFAVRSSALLEDGEQFSLAGQLETALNVPRHAILQEIIRCWASLFAPRVDGYLRRIAASERRMAVVVQELIESSWAGVAFSLDPLTKSYDHLIIEWTTGLGDRLVGGQIVPERLRLLRAGPDLPESTPARLRAHLHALHHHVQTIERAFERPVDVEWCATPDELWLLQARPITGLDERDHIIWSDVNLAENFPSPLAPLAGSFVSRFYQEYMRSTLRLFGWRDAEFSAVSHLLRELTGLHGGRIYYNLTSWYGLISYFPWRSEFQRFLDTYIGQSVPIRTEPDPRAPALRQRQQGPWGCARFLSSLVASFAGTGRALTKLEQRLARKRQGWRKAVSAAQDPRDVLDSAESMLDFVAQHWGGPCGADLMAMVLPGLLGVLAERWCGLGSAETLPRLLQGVSVKSDEPAHLLWRLSQLLSATDAGRSDLETSEYERARQRMRPEENALFDEFLRRFGARCYADCSLIAPTFEEEPALAWQLVKGFAAVPDRFSPAARLPLITDREAFLGGLCQKVPAWQGRLLRILTRSSLKAIRHREAGRLQQSLLFGEARRAFRRLGQILADRGTLPQADDVFFCTLAELSDLARGAYLFPGCLPLILRERRAQYAAAQHDRAPTLFLLRAGETWLARPEPPESTPHAAPSLLRGVLVSRGKVRAVARVVRNPFLDQALQPGEILVAPSTDPGWTPLFLLAGGLVLERGGVLSHGAIIARELGIPALVGVSDACTLIRDGSQVLLDANSGTIQLE